MSLPRRRVLVVSALAVETASVLGVATLAAKGALPSAVVLSLLGAFIPYVVALRISRGFEPTFVGVVAATAVMGGILVIAPPALSDDLFRYLWEGRVWLEGANPYRLAPDDPSLAFLRDSLWEPINNKPLASIYPPLMQLIFALCAWLGGKVWTIKLLALLGLIASVAILMEVTGRPRTALALGANPVALSETALNGHFDFLVGGMLLLAAWQLGRHAYRSAAFSASVAIGLKVVGVVLLPLFWRRRFALGAALCSALLLLLPLVLWRAPGDPSSGPGQFAMRWQGNDSLFALVHALARAALEPRAAALAARLVVALLLLAVIVLVVRARLPALPAARLLVWTVLLLSPQVHPWYLGWLLPLEVACGGRAGLVWSGLVLVAYAPLDRWAAEQVWQMPRWLHLAEYLLLAAALALDPKRPWLGQRRETGASLLISGH